MNKLSGAEFDDAYMQQQVKDHQTTILLFQTEANSGQDTKLKAFAAETLPILQHHLQMAQDIALIGLAHRADRAVAHSETDVL